MQRGLFKPTPTWGIIYFIVATILLITVAFPVQSRWGMGGLVITELLILFLALAPIFGSGWDRKEVFKMKIPAGEQLGGILLLWIGTYLIVFVISRLLSYFFPTQMQEVNQGISEMFLSVPLAFSLLIAAVMPAICEEALFRGLLLYTFKEKSKWFTIIASAILFGIFHVSVYRFLPTAILGGAMAFIILETENLILPILFHFINNAVGIILIFASGPNTIIDGIPLYSVGYGFFAAAFAPWLILAGSRLLWSKKKRERKEIDKKMVVLVALFSIAFLIGGFCLTDTVPATKIFETNFSLHLNADWGGMQQRMVVEESAQYEMKLNFQGSDFRTKVSIVNELGRPVFSVEEESLNWQGFLDLTAGEYTIFITHDYEGRKYLPFKLSMNIQ